MSDDIELASGEHVPIQATVCECEHGYYDHPYSRVCEVSGCDCAGFVAGWDEDAAGSA